MKVAKVAWAQSLLLATLCLVLQSPGFAEVRFHQRLGRVIPREIEFQTDAGDKIPLSRLSQGRPLILVLAYYRCPNLCTLVLNGLVNVLKKLPDRLGSDYEVATVSIDPNEGPSLASMKKRTYLAELGAPSQSGWAFLTGESASIRALADSVGFVYEQDPLSKEYSHPSGIVVLTPSGKISQYFFGIQFDPKRLHQALKNASLEKSGGWIEEILLYCLHYDPKSTRSGAIVMSVIRVAALMGLFALLGFLCRLTFSTRKAEP